MLLCTLSDDSLHGFFAWCPWAFSNCSLYYCHSIRFETNSKKYLFQVYFFLFSASRYVVLLLFFCIFLLAVRFVFRCHTIYVTHTQCTYSKRSNFLRQRSKHRWMFSLSTNLDTLFCTHEPILWVFFSPLLLLVL